MLRSPMQDARRWLLTLCAAVWVMLVHSGARAHDLAIDQLVLWPDPASGILRGEITFDPELTRSKDAIPGNKDEVHVRAFLADQVRVEVDGDELSINFVVRELWVMGGATPGDLVVFTAALPPGSKQMRVFAGRALPSLVISVQDPTPDGHSEAWSWLLRGGEWTPDYPLRLAPGPSPAASTGWRRGGSELFADSKANRPGANVADPEVAEPAPPAAAASSRAAETAAPGLGSLALRFVGLGYEHILPQGIDHLLFIAGLVLGAVRRTRHILIALTLFTLAHTLTLGLSQLSWLCAPPSIVEPLIALSICLVGVDNLRARSDSPGHTRRRNAVVFIFGLVHGLGFGSALAEMHFAGSQLLVALLSFNLGVELGQITFVLLLLAALHRVQNPATLKRYVVVPGSLGIALAGFAFALARVFG